MEHAAAIEKSAAAVKAAAAARVAETDVWRGEGDKSAAHKLARKSGIGVGAARDALEAGKKMRELPEVAAAARSGELSPQQTAAIADAASADPSAERRLVEKAKPATHRRGHWKVATPPRPERTRAWWRAGHTACVRVTEHDRRYMQRVARDLAALERDDQPDEDALQRAVDRANRARRAQRRPDLAREEEHPESELYRRARALGLR